MAKEKTCLRCGSTNLEPGMIQSTGRVRFRATNTKVMTLQTGDVTIDASICLDCGTLELVGDVKKAKSLTGKAKPA
jgi:predicted nucleic-acid-binding Zn-ribbon protein